MDVKIALSEVTRRPLAQLVCSHLDGVYGIENIPTEGPVILVANHRSFFDHFVMRAVVAARRSGRCWFPTKKEAFDHRISRAFHEAWDAIPVDRDRPSLDSFNAITGALGNGDAVVIYPEGTRNTRLEMLPFKSGAFMAALIAEAPVIPVAMIGTDAVLPPGGRRPRAETVTVCIGEPLTLPGPGRQVDRIEALSTQARSSVESLIALALSHRKHPATATPPFDISHAVSQRLESVIDPGGHIEETDSDLLEFLASCCSAWFRSDDDIAIQYARLLGLRAEHINPVGKVWSATRVRRLCESVLHRNPDHFLANYLMGRWHLRVPAALGGRRATGLEYLRRAMTVAAPGETRAHMAVAETYLAYGRVHEAAEALSTVLEHTDPAHPRHTIRTNRCQTLLREITEVPDSAGIPG